MLSGIFPKLFFSRLVSKEGGDVMWDDPEYDSEVVANMQFDRKVKEVASVLLGVVLLIAIALLLAFPPHREDQNQIEPMQQEQEPDLAPTILRASWDFGKAERYKLGTVRIAPYPLMQTYKSGGVNLKITVFVEPHPDNRWLRVNWFYENGGGGGAERDLSPESPIEFNWDAIHVPRGTTVIVVTLGRWQNGKQKYLKFQKEAIVQ